MNIKIIDEKDQFAQCETFEITHLLWGTKAIPKTYGKIACWKDHGFLVEMTCEEADPLRTYTKMNDPVSLDSGMEAFLSLWADRTPLYVNVEMNANGATLMQYGTGRADRTFFTEEQIRQRAAELGKQISEDYAGEETENVVMLRNPISADALVQSVKTLAHCRMRMQQLRAKGEKLSRTLEERKLIDRAKGKLMDVFHLTESEAHYKIQKTSMDSGRRIADVAREILESSENMAS